MFNIIHLHSMIISREQNIAIKAGNGILKCLKNDKRYMKTDQHDWNFTATTKKKKKRKNPKLSQLERVNPPPPGTVPFFFLSDMELESSENSKIPDLNMYKVRQKTLNKYCMKGIIMFPRIV